MTPDQKPPPRTDMSAIDEVLEYANAINCKSAFQPTIDAACAELSRLKELANEHDRHHDTLCAITAILLNGAGCWTKELLVNALTTLRDELERVKAEAGSQASVPVEECGEGLAAQALRYRSERDQLRTQLAEQSAKMEQMEQQFGEAVGTIDSLERRNTTLESQAGAMREALKGLYARFETSTIGGKEALEQARQALSTQAGADLLKRVQALEVDKRRLEPRFDSLVLRCNRCKRLFYACMIRALRDADTFKDIASMLTAGATVELLEDKQELKRSEFGCKCAPAEYAALSQEQATPRNV